MQTRDRFIIKEEEVTEWIEQITRKPVHEFPRLTLSTSFSLLINTDSFTIQNCSLYNSNVHLLQLGANSPEELAEALSDGYVLCELANCLLNDTTGTSLQFHC